MSNFPGYTTRNFSETQKFFVLDPQTGTPSFVLGSDLVNQLTPNSNYVFAESTRATAQATDYAVGQLIQTAGAVTEGDGLASGYLVVPSGDGDFPMDNGNELLVISGDDALREQLISNASGEGSDLVAHTGTANTVTETLDQNIADINQRVIYVGSVAGLIGTASPIDGAHYVTTAYHPGEATGSERYYWDADRDKADHTGGDVIDPGKTFPADWSVDMDVASWFTADGVGTGCYVAVEDRSAANMVEKFGALESIADNSRAIQACADAVPIVCGLPKKTYRHSSTITLSLFNATLLSENVGNGYSGVCFEYDGSSDQFFCQGSVNYLNLERVRLKGVPAVGTDYYNTGTSGVNITAGNTSVTSRDSWLEGFEILFWSANNSFYNQFTGCRLEKAATLLQNFNSNNLQFERNRCLRFNTGMRIAAADGPTNIERNAFEIFNGPIAVGTGSDSKINVRGNYVEIGHNTDLPTNFPASGPGAQAGKFGGNTLFTGDWGAFTLDGNDMQLEGAFRVATLDSVGAFRAVNNGYKSFASGSNLDRLYSAPQCDSVYISDPDANLVGAGPYSRSYSQTLINASSVDAEWYHRDAITGVVLSTAKSSGALALQNGWAAGTATFGAPHSMTRAEGVYLSGLLDGTSKTGDLIATLPSARRPAEIGTSKDFALMVSTNNLHQGSSTVVFRYYYDSGNFELENAPASLNNIPLDGLFIPART